jgi:hypothetical protein
MGLFNGDIVIKTAIELGMKDIRQNLWLIDDILSQVVQDEYLKDAYGQKEIDACKQWFANNNIPVYLRYRRDKDEFPCITIALQSSNEKIEMKHMGDASTEVETLMPEQIGKPISYIVKPFTPDNYDISNGEITVPNTVKINKVRPGMILVNPSNGNGYVITSVKDQSIFIEPGIEIDAIKLGVVPQFPFYRARREHTFFQETYSIGCHVHGDPAALLWLHAIVMYCLLRYREGLLEARCFTESAFSSSDFAPNNNFNNPGGELVYSRYINLTGQVEVSWLKTPQRIIESADLVDYDEPFKGGIKIISRKAPDFLDTEEDVWTTID